MLKHLSMPKNVRRGHFDHPIRCNKLKKRNGTLSRHYKTFGKKSHEAEEKIKRGTL